jgi:hypothetical protein
MVVGGYQGRLSARGGTIELRDVNNNIVASSSYAPAPTELQNFLRITEINFAPAPPTPQELQVLPGLKAGDFEFVELINTGAAPINLGGAQFDRGISFVFPADFMLDPGARTVIVSQQAGFALRYGTGFNIAGQFEGNLDNAGEELRLLDAVGEEVLRFTYSPTWYPPADAGGYSLVTRSANPGFDSYNVPNSWAISGQIAGTPGGEETSFSQAFEGWRFDHFTPTEQTDVLISGPAADPDNDTRDNLTEYQFARDPRQSDEPLTTTLSTVTVNDVEYVAINFNRPKQAVDVTYTVEISSDGATWGPNGFLAGIPQDLGNGIERATFAVTGLSQPHTNYHIRPAALSTSGNRVGDELTFLTANTNPVANDKSMHAPPVGVPTVVYSANDTSDADGDARTLAVLAYTGAGSVTSDNNQITFTNGGFSGAETVQVGASDGFGGTAAGTLTLRNAAPVATADHFSVGAASAVFDVLANDSDPDGDVLTIVSVSSATGNNATTDGATIAFTPTSDFGGSDELSYVVGDGHGGTATGTVTVLADHSIAHAIAKTNEAVPGVPGAFWTLFGSPSVFSEGKEAGWLATAKVGASRLNGVFSGNIGAPVLRIRSNDPAPDANGAVSGARFRSFRQPVFANGDFAVIAKIAGSGVSGANDTGIWAQQQGTLRALAREGEVAPGTNGGTFRAFTSVAMPGGDAVFFTAALKLQRGTVTTANDTGVWVGTTLALREGTEPRSGNRTFAGEVV